jgi:hypothetical protein
MLRSLWVWFLLASTTSCAAPAPSRMDAAAKPLQTRPNAECAVERSKVLKVLSDSELPDVIPAQLLGIMLPPVDRPDDLRGQTRQIIFLLDEEGRVVRDSSDAPLSTDVAWSREFRARLRRYQFLPATLNGCAVPSRFVIGIAF